jgi:hypothetical protein
MVDSIVCPFQKLRTKSRSPISLHFFHFAARRCRGLRTGACDRNRRGRIGKSQLVCQQNPFSQRDGESSIEGAPAADRVGQICDSLLRPHGGKSEQGK